VYYNMAAYDESAPDMQKIKWQKQKITQKQIRRNHAYAEILK